MRNPELWKIKCRVCKKCVTQHTFKCVTQHTVKLLYKKTSENSNRYGTTHDFRVFTLTSMYRHIYIFSATAIYCRVLSNVCLIPNCSVFDYCPEVVVDCIHYLVDYIESFRWSSDDYTSDNDDRASSHEADDDHRGNLVCRTMISNSDRNFYHKNVNKNL